MPLLSRAVLLPLILAACGDPLVDADYRGQPLFAFKGQAFSFNDVRVTDAPIRVSLFWSPGGRTDAPPGGLVEQTPASGAVSFPAAFTVRIFQPPAAELLVGDPGAYGVAAVLVYQDNDGDGTLTPGADPPERVLWGFPRL